METTTVPKQGFTREEFAAALEKIDWKLRFVGATCYRPVNHLGEVCAFMVHGDSLKLDTWGDTRGVFGAKASEHGQNGTLCFEMSKCYLDVQNDCVHVHTEHSHAFLSFYNHTRPHIGAPVQSLTTEGIAS